MGIDTSVAAARAVGELRQSGDVGKFLHRVMMDAVACERLRTSPARFADEVIELAAPELRVNPRRVLDSAGNIVESTRSLYEITETDFVDVAAEEYGKQLTETQMDEAVKHLDEAMGMTQTWRDAVEFCVEIVLGSQDARVTR